jgi:hypothetical protein
MFLFALIPFVYAQGSSSGCGSDEGLSNPLQNICSFGDFVELLLQGVIRIGLPIAVLFIVYSGFLFVTAQGSVTKLDEAKKTFLWTVVGVAIFLGSWTLAMIVKETIVLLTG